MILTLVPFLVLCADPAAAAPPPTGGGLAVELTAGQTFGLQVTDDLRTTVEVRGLALETRFLLEQEREVRVAERRADGSYLLEIQLGRVQGSVQLPLAKPVAFDSRGAERMPGRPG